MSILFTGRARDEANDTREGAVKLTHVISALESLNPERLDSDWRVQRIEDADEEIYVFHDAGLRVFLTKKGRDIVILSITENNPFSQPRRR